MPLRTRTLMSASARPSREVARTLAEAEGAERRTAFLCHSHLDAQLVRGLVTLLAEQGWDVYVDWQDTSLPATPDRRTARQIKLRIADAEFFLFLATRRSTRSRWCPWEIGYADAVKPLDSILIIPTEDDDGRHHGNEYLQLYRMIDVADDRSLAAWRPGDRSNGVAVASL